ncbi:leucine-rich PPR motif-containing protein, mitochondrial-like [Tigriopus californicus]|uniref:leucine-rich PPR motif-containing protein, mitochondrial-like n=1 Tax=Tigriopus californicus TaxID=6832 RepID=UPI0027DA904C|nr:leucine-rich PPR motif-containing protein, mitochondrial-like [Tigriopus californicus]
MLRGPSHRLAGQWIRRQTAPAGPSTPPFRALSTMRASGLSSVPLVLGPSSRGLSETRSLLRLGPSSSGWSWSPGPLTYSTTSLDVPSLSADSPSRVIINREVEPTRAEGLCELERLIHGMSINIQRSGRVLPIDFTLALHSMKRLESCTANQALTLLRACGQLMPDERPEDRVQLTLGLWELLETLKVPLDTSHYNALLKSHMENEHKVAPMEFVTWMEGQGAEPNRVTYQQLIACFCEHGQVNEALSILELMKTKQFPINEEVFVALIKGHCKSGDFVSAQSTIQIMSQSGLDLGSQGKLAYLVGMVEAGQPWSEVKAYWDSADGTQCEDVANFDDHDVFQIVIALVKQNEIQGAQEALQRLPRKSGFFQEVRNVVPRLVNLGQADMAFELFTSFKLPPKAIPNNQAAASRDHGMFLIRALVKQECPIPKLKEILQVMSNDINDECCARVLEVCVDLNKIEYGQSARDMIVEEFGNEALSAKHFALFTRRMVERMETKDDVMHFLSKLGKLGIALDMSTVSNQLLKKILQSGRVSETIEELRQVLQNRYGYTWLCNSALQYLLNQHTENNLARAAEFMVFRCPKGISPILWNASLARAYLTTDNLHHFVAIYSQCFVMNILSFHAAKDEMAAPRQLMNLQMTLIHLHSLAPRFSPDSPPDEVLGKVLDKLLENHLGLFGEGADQLKNNVSDPVVLKKVETLIEMGEDAEYWTPERVADMQRKNRSLFSQSAKRSPTDKSYLHNQKVRIEQLESEVSKSVDSGDPKTSAMFALCTKYNELLMPDKTVKLCQEHITDFKPNSSLVRNTILTCLQKSQVSQAAEFVLFLNENDVKVYKTSILDVIKELIKTGKDQALILNLVRILPNHMYELSTPYYLKLIDCLQAYNPVEQCDQIDEFVNAALESKEHDKLKLGSLIHQNKLPEAVELFEKVVAEERKVVLKRLLIRKLVEEESLELLQRVVDASIKIIGEENSIYDLAMDFLVMGKYSQARKLLESPGLRYNSRKAQYICIQFVNDQNSEAMEKFVLLTRDLFACDRNYLYDKLLDVMSCQPKKINDVWLMMQEEGHVPTIAFKIKMASLLKKHGEPVPFEEPQPRQTTPSMAQTLSKEDLSSSSSSSSSDEEEEEEEQEDTRKTAEKTTKI